VAICAFLNGIISEGPDIMGFVGWMGIMLMTIIMGIWSVVQKEN